MEVYSVLLINQELKNPQIIGTFNSFKKAKDKILFDIDMMIEDSDISWYRNHGTRRLSSFENDLDKDWETKPFDIYRIVKSKMN